MSRRRSSLVRNAPWGAATVVLVVVVLGLAGLAVGTVLALIEGHDGVTPYRPVHFVLAWAFCMAPILITVSLLVDAALRRRRTRETLGMARRAQERDS